MKKDIIKKFYEKLWNNSNLIQVGMTKKERNVIMNKAKFLNKDISKFENFEDYKNEFLYIFPNLDKYKSLVLELKKQFNTKKGLQSGIITECMFIQTLANNMKLNEFCWIDREDESSSIHNKIIKMLINFATSKQIEHNLWRYIYSDKAYKNFLIQYGDSETVDAIYIESETNDFLRIEIKEQKAKLGEFDFVGFDGKNGKILVDDEWSKKYSTYQGFVEKFNNKYSAFDFISDSQKEGKQSKKGKNYKIFQDIDYKNEKEEIANCIDFYFDKLKKIDILITENNIGSLIPMTKQQVIEFGNTSGSEIRLSGRNGAKLSNINLEYCKEKLSNEGFVINEEEYCYKPIKDITNWRFARNYENTISGLKINSILFVKFKNKTRIENIRDISEYDKKLDSIKFEIKNVMELKPSISIHFINSWKNETINKIYKQILSDVHIK